MKYKNLFIAVFVLFSCLNLSIGLVHTSAYGSDTKSKATVNGVVSQVSGTTVSILSNKMSIDASKAKVKLEDCDAVMTVANIKEGDFITAEGKMSSGSFAANVISLSGAGKLAGTVDAVGTGTVTILGQVIDTSSASCTKGKIKVGKKAQASVRASTSGLTALVIKAEDKKQARRSSDDGEEITPTDNDYHHDGHGHDDSPK